jgi:hypothetical protein
LLQSRPKKWYSVWQPFTNIDSFGRSKDIWLKGPSMSNNLQNFACHHNHKEIYFLSIIHNLAITVLNALNFDNRYQRCYFLPKIYDVLKLPK